jgi:hypothetical protein
MPSFGATGFDNQSATSGFHTGAETVTTFAD